MLLVLTKRLNFRKNGSKITTENRNIKSLNCLISNIIITYRTLMWEEFYSLYFFKLRHCLKFLNINNNKVVILTI